ncbi:hypothetical protein N7509_007899 [Penicillium cosmopolitanum]|uniref:Mid2 domain-containing protein n=1 Tax=Penicillium cosmopolitanum TaxID=1131564 RepID=A0A9W9VZS8_9EURO|nr:uncharacterized protein N7509_007899 [Penicillium cosmopolitanum]KAJ5392409.1 hypothetical protein N7509_007899 [Penicillium cosmopolitanum]
MISTHSFKSLVLTSLLLQFGWSPLVHAAPWIITEANQVVPITELSYDSNEDYITKVTTSIEAIIPTVTSLPEAISTLTQTNTYYDYTITAVEKLYPSGVGTAINVNAGYYDNYYSSDYKHTTVFVVDLTYTAPTGCSSTWTTTTAATLSALPATLSALLPRTKTSVSLSVDTSVAFQPTTYTYDQVWVEPTQVPASSLASLRNENYPSSLYGAGSNCYYHSSYVDSTGSTTDRYDPNTGLSSGPGSTTFTSGTSSDSDSGTSSSSYPYNYYGYGYWDEYDEWNGKYYSGISLLAVILISVLGWIGVWFLAGILEAFIRFRRLMLGWQTRRGLPVCWAMTILPLSLCCLWGFRKGYRARSVDDAAILKERWEKMGFWKKFCLFWVWGFRYKYPTVLGPAPPQVRVSKRPGYAWGGYGYGNADGVHPAPLLGPEASLRSNGSLQGSARGLAPVNTAPGMAQVHTQTQVPAHGQGQQPLQPLPRAVVPEASGALPEGEGEGQGGVGQAHSR